MDRPHYLRFVQAITLAAVAGGCGARTLGDERYGLDAAAEPGDDDARNENDSENDSATASDVGATPETPIGTLGACRNFGTSAVICAPGGTCLLPIGSFAPECRSGIAGAAPCGIITCGEGCTCSPITPNACDCARATEGPLPPPDLPIAIGERVLTS